MSKRWSGGFWLDESWQYSDPARERIAQHLDRAYLARITFAAQMYRSMRANELEKPRGANIRRQLDELGESCHRLLRALELDEPAQFEMEKYDQEAGEIRREVERKVTALRTLAWAAERDYKARGRPREESRRFLIHRLADIWIEAHGNQPTREVTGHHETSPFAYFIRDCVSELAGFEHGVDDLIREVVDSRKN